MQRAGMHSNRSCGPRSIILFLCDEICFCLILKEGYKYTSNFRLYNPQILLSWQLAENQFFGIDSSISSNTIREFFTFLLPPCLICRDARFSTQNSQEADLRREINAPAGDQCDPPLMSFLNAHNPVCVSFLMRLQCVLSLNSSLH